MTVCNMSVEGGAKAGFIAPDEKAYAYLKDKPKAPKGKAWDEAMRYWETLRSDDSAHFDREIKLDAAKLPPLVTWGTSPEQVITVTGRVPVPSEIPDDKKRIAAERSLGYMGLKGGEKITDIKLDRVFIGSCTNARIEDLREVARVVEGKQVNGNVNAMIVPGSGLVKVQAEAEGLDKIFKAAGFRLARAGLFNVPRHEPGQACRQASVAHRPRTATSKAAKVTRDGRTLSRLQWLPQPQSQGTSSTCGSGNNAAHVQDLNAKARRWRAFHFRCVAQTLPSKAQARKSTAIPTSNTSAARLPGR